MELFTLFALLVVFVLVLMYVMRGQDQPSDTELDELLKENEQELDASLSTLSPASVPSIEPGASAALIGDIPAEPVAEGYRSGREGLEGMPTNSADEIPVEAPSPIVASMNEIQLEPPAVTIEPTAKVQTIKPRKPKTSTVNQFTKPYGTLEINLGAVKSDSGQPIPLMVSRINPDVSFASHALLFAALLPGKRLGVNQIGRVSLLTENRMANEREKANMLKKGVPSKDVESLPLPELMAKHHSKLHETGVFGSPEEKSKFDKKAKRYAFAGLAAVRLAQRKKIPGLDKRQIVIYLVDGKIIAEFSDITENKYW